MTPQRALAVLAGLLAGPALADCPTTLADAAHGVYVDFDGYVVRYDRRPDGSVEELEFDTPTGGGYRYISLGGIYVVESWTMESGFAVPGTHETITYENQPDPELRPNSTFSSNTTIHFDNGDAPFDEFLSIAVGPSQSQRIGTCTLDAMRVEMRTGPVGSVQISNFLYFPTLGFGTYIGGGAEGENYDLYRPTAISTEPPLARNTDGGGGGGASGGGNEFGDRK
ncbi:hypothetical protein HKCCE2091_19815 [Rhodobacterales bacterium HKCCE2091]|nr:hypothetical protein [Rhodobacterales bacterium HKCCE2091]